MKISILIAERLKKELDSVYEQKTCVDNELQSKIKELYALGETLHSNQTEVGKLREAEFCEAINKLERKVQELEQQLKQKIESSQHQQDVRRTTGASASSNNEFESLSREQLIHRIQREITLKDQVSLLHSYWAV
uniref:Uncharacterized protein n=1 Tax=Panagrolaimus superbus TaxID=310955 RepID=A0A914YIS9_9BILA